MKTLLKVSALALLLGLSQGAGAAVLSLDDYNRFETQTGGSAAIYDFGALNANDTYDWTSRLDVKGKFEQIVNFSIGAGSLAGSLYNTQVKTTKLNIDDLSYSLWSGGSEVTLAKSFSVPLTGAQYSVFGASGLSGGDYQLHIAGDAVGSGITKGGDITYGQYNLSITPVPEPEEWAMMILGAGLIGVHLLRKNNVQDAVVMYG